MNNHNKHLDLEQNLHVMFEEIRSIMRAATLASIQGTFPRELTKTFVNSVVESMKNAQKETCYICPEVEKCEIKDSYSDSYKLSGFDSMESELKKIMEFQKEASRIIIPKGGSVH